MGMEQANDVGLVRLYYIPILIPDNEVQFQDPGIKETFQLLTNERLHICK